MPVSHTCTDHATPATSGDYLQQILCDPEHDVREFPSGAGVGRRRCRRIRARRRA